MASNPYALTQQSGAAPSGIGLSYDSWVSNRGGDRGFTGADGKMITDPMLAYQYAQQYGLSGAQVDGAYGAKAGQSDQWVKDRGLSALGGQSQQPGQMRIPSPPPMGGQQVQPMQPAQPAQQVPSMWGGLSVGVGSQNPYLQAQGDAIAQQVNRNVSQNQMPMIARGAALNGSYGGSRQGVAQGIAMQGANDSIANATASLYGNAYESNQNRAMQGGLAQMQDATQRDLGFGNLALGNQNSQNQYALGLGGLQNNAAASNQSFYGQQRGQDLQAQQQGYNQTRQGWLDQFLPGQIQAGIGREEYNQSWSPLQNYGNALSPFSGLNGSTNRTDPQTGGGLAGAAGGALTMAQIWALLNKGG